MADLVTFGEAMLRLAPPDRQRLEQASSFDVCVGGGEFNVAVGGARLGLTTAWVSKLPQNPLGQMVRNVGRAHGVDMSSVVWSDAGRQGLYFCEFGAAPRASSVVYDRSGSAVSTIQPGEVDWARLFESAKWFHVSGISPALSDEAAKTTTAALEAARAAGCTTSYDLNFRAKLWTEQAARAYTEPVMRLVDVLITTEEDTARVFGIRGDSYEAVARQLQESFGFQAVAVTLRENLSVWRNRWSALVLAEGQTHQAPTYEVEIVDRVGAGDSYAAGLITGRLQGRDYAEANALGVAFSAIKHSIPGDLNLASMEETERVMRGGGLRISR